MLCKKQIAILFFLLLATAVATHANTTPRATTLGDSQEPGSVVVFPLFKTGSVTAPADLPYGATSLPVTSFEVSVVCPEGIDHCVDGDDVDIHFEWVCPGFQLLNLNTCRETNFILNTTVGGTIRFEPKTELCRPNAPFDADERLHACGQVLAPPCPEGYLIGWVVDEFNRPIKFDGLIGDAVLRENSGAVTAYNAIPIQGAPALASRALIPVGPGGALKFDGASYQEVTGAITGSVQLDFINAAGVDQDQTALILITLDVISNRANPPTDVDLRFYNETETMFSQHFQFTCFGDTGSIFNGNLSLGVDPLNSSGFGVESSISPETLKALLQSTAAVQPSGPATILGLVLTRECDPVASCGGSNTLRHFAYPLSNDSVPVATSFVP